MTFVYIAYPGDKNTRFDRDYYSRVHLPLVMDCWAAHGLENLAVFYPKDDGKGVIAICVCTFTDENSIEASFRSGRTQEVMLDIPRFTDAQPQQQRMVPIEFTRRQWATHD